MRRVSITSLIQLRCFQWVDHWTRPGGRTFIGFRTRFIEVHPIFPVNQSIAGLHCGVVFLCRWHLKYANLLAFFRFLGWLTPPVLYLYPTMQSTVPLPVPTRAQHRY